MSWFIRCAPLKSQQEDVFNYTNDFAFDHQQHINSSNEKKMNQLSNAILLHIYKTVLIHFK